jgi:hypothetical protein
MIARLPARPGRHHPPAPSLGPARAVRRLPGRLPTSPPGACPQSATTTATPATTSTTPPICSRLPRTCWSARWSTPANAAAPGPPSAQALDTTPEQARDQHTATVEQWEDALDRRWERTGRFLASRMPDGASEPDQTIADLDRWCLRHLEHTSGVRRIARDDGIEDRMVSASLPKHTLVTELTCVTHTANYLIKHGTDATQAERSAYEIRKKALMTKLGADETYIHNRQYGGRAATGRHDGCVVPQAVSCNTSNWLGAVGDRVARRIRC